MMKTAIATLAALLMTTSAASAIQCQTHGKSWRLIDGRKCWHMGHRSTPKAMLHWGTKQVALRTPADEPETPPKPKILPPPMPMPDNSLMLALEKRADDIRNTPMPQKLVRVETISEPPIYEVVPNNKPPIRVVLPGAPEPTPPKVAAPVTPKPAIPTPELPTWLLAVLIILLIGGVLTNRDVYGTT